MSKQFGGMFAESIDRGHKKFFRRKSPDDIQSAPRILVLLTILLFSVGLLGARIFDLTILKGTYYRKLSEENRIREIKRVAPRGIIYDRNGDALVRNIPKIDEVTQLQPKLRKEDTVREYTYGQTFAHVIGYTGEVSPQELKELNAELSDTFMYRQGDIIGKYGVEKYYEELLRGIDGKDLVEVDALGNPLRKLGSVDPKPGSNVHLTLDLDLQQVASSSMGLATGAILATDPMSGEILSLYSSPSFNPNVFVKGIGVEQIFSDPRLPLFNRVISGTYPPGSTFKIISAIAGLETGSISRTTQFEDVGIIHIGPFSFPNWYFAQYGRKEGNVDVVKGLKRSNDIFFYKAGEAIGIDTLAQWARKLGLGTGTGIDLDGEERGIMPDTKWKRSHKNEDWFLGDTYHVAIGQGDLLTTPIQVNTWTNVVANGGYICRPHLVHEDKAKSTSRSTYCKNLGLKVETLGLVREGLKEACATGGTGWPLFDFSVSNPQLKADGVDFFDSPSSTQSGQRKISIPTACKTGTAEYGDPQNKTHAWFTVFAPVNHPTISITVLVEGGGEGSSVAAPIAKKMLEAWFGR